MVNKILEGLKMTFPDGTTADKWVPQSELIASRERVITLEKQLEDIVEHYTDPEAKAFELQCELEVRDEWIDKLVAVKNAAAILIERVPEPILLGAGAGSQLDEPVRYRLRIRQVASMACLLEPLWYALIELDEFGEGAK